MKKALKFAKIGIISALVIGIAIFALLLYLFIGVLRPYYDVPRSYKAVTDYNPASNVVSQETLDALANSKKANKLELGVNKDGNVVFKHPYKAFGRLKKEYKKTVWKYGDKELKMKHLSRTFYIHYTDEDVVQQLIAGQPDNEKEILIYKEILQIYSNSYKVHR